MAPSVPDLAEAHTEFDFGLDFVDEFDALMIKVKGDEQMDFVPPGKYPAKLHAQKVADELCSQHGITSGLIFLPGEPTRLYEDSDMSPPFRQRRYFYYMSGADFPDCALTYDLKTSKLILWVPYVEPRQVLWYGRTPSPADCLSRLDVDDVRYMSEMDPYIAQTLVSTPRPTLYLLHPSHRPRLSPDASPKVRVDLARLLPAMDDARVVKTEYEVSMIRRANAVSSAAHRRVAATLLSMRNEREIEAAFRHECALLGAKNQAYSPIAGSGTNASTLHYEDNDQPLAGRELVVVDAGCEWDCYASDITRTLPLSGRFSDEAAAVYAVVDRMQRECIAAVRPGVLYYKLHLHAAAVGVAGLLSMGILKGGSVNEIYNAGTIAAFFPHGLGHHIGLETHDASGRDRLLLSRDAEARTSTTAAHDGGAAGPLGSKMRRQAMDPDAVRELLPWASPPPFRGRQKLEKNMVLTIEPGIYFCREYLEGYFLSHPVHSRYIDKDILEKYYPVGGVRIEDDILVTADGYENLTTAPKGKEMLRVINGGVQR